ncbi:MAG: hypothetical protein KAT43_02840 [Nanoarchaeota archaeon]|nr:hypothetical protein [Nanoarchaeota archaeon]
MADRGQIIKNHDVVELVQKDSKFVVGFDVGSDSVHYALLDKSGDVRKTGSLVHFGNPMQAVDEAFDDIVDWLETDGFGLENIASTSFTGEGGELIAKKTGCLFEFDSVTIPKGASKLDEEAKYVFHIGAKSPYFFDIEKGEEQTFAFDVGTGTKCGGGSGILIEKQIKRVYGKDSRISLEDLSDAEGEEEIKIQRRNRKALEAQRERMFEHAEKEVEAATADIEVGGRCGVVIQSDMIHHQNLRHSVNVIVKGMLKTIAKNYKSDVIRMRKLKLSDARRAICTGGLANNKFILATLKDQFGFDIDVPEDHLHVGAIGIAMKALEAEDQNVFDSTGLEAALDEEMKKIIYAPRLSLEDVEFVNGCEDYDPDAELECNISEGKTIDAIIGIDGGSTTSKAVVIDAKTGQMLFKRYLYTDGQPAEVGKRLLSEIKGKFRDRINLIAARVTGSSSKLYRTIFFRRSDKDADPDIVDLAPIKDEITCHAAGIKYFDPEVDTIFELGGQDAKFTRFNGQVVSNSKMNLSCMAGTGQTRQNMAETKGFDVKKKKGKEGKFLEDYAFLAERIPVCDSTCGVFSEADIKKFIALGLSDQEIAAAIEYAAIAGYVQKFVGNEDLGDVISAQGGPFLSKSTLAVLAQLTGKKIKAFPYREIMGAFGAAISLKQEIDELKEEGRKFQSRFMGYDALYLEFKVEDVNCSDAIGADSCGIKNCTLCRMNVGGEVTLSNGRCPKGNTGEEHIDKTTDFVKTYNRMLNSRIKKDGRAMLLLDYQKKLEDTAREGEGVSKLKKDTVGIPRAFSFLNEKGIFYVEIFKELGLKPIVSDEADDDILNLGKEFAFSENCVPAIDFYGQAAAMRPFVEKLFFPDATNAITKDDRRQKFCPHSSSISFTARQSMGMQLNEEKDEKVIDPVLHFNDKHRPLEKALKRELDRVYGKGRFSLKEIRRAVALAQQRQAEFIEKTHEMGHNFISKMADKGEYGFALVGRGYTLFDEKASSSTNVIFSNLGLNAIPSYYLDSSSVEVPKIVKNMFWVLGERIIQDFVYALCHPRLFPILMTNFNCGPDSMLLYHLDSLAKKAKKPYIVLQTDGHNSNAQFETRIRAFNEIAKNFEPESVYQDKFFMDPPVCGGMERILGVPYMGEGSYAFAAAMRNEGIKAEIMPTWTENSQRWARKLVSTQACKPMHVQVGDILSFVEGKTKLGCNPEDIAVFEPSAKGPCRFGQYHVIIEKLLEQQGFGEVAVVSPSSATNYSDIDLTQKQIRKLKLLIYKGIIALDIMRSALMRTRPYEIKDGDAQEVYQAGVSAVEADLEHTAGKNLAHIMKESAGRFESIPRQGERRPIVDFEGEIFVRQHNPANENAIELAEKNGLEVVIAPTYEWLDYINWLRTYEAGVEARAFKSDFFKKAKKWLSGKIKLWYTSRVAKKLWDPFSDYLEGREFHDPRPEIEKLDERKLWSKEIEGESGVSVAKSNEFIRHGSVPVPVDGDYAVRSGIMQVGPWGCMQETAAAFATQCAISNKRQQATTTEEKIIPYINLAYGDSAPPNIESEMASFAEQCRLKRRETLKKFDPKAEIAERQTQAKHYSPITNILGF